MPVNTDDTLMLSRTTDPSLRSWVESANSADTDFPIQNLPFGVFSDDKSDRGRVGVAIGDLIVDLCELESAGLLAVPYVVTDDDGLPKSVFRQSRLNDFVALGKATWSSIRIQLSTLLSADNATLRDDPELREQAFVRQSDAVMRLPFDIPGYTDFYSSREHATNVGAMFRDPKNALMPNWLEIPIGYNGRASSVVVSGTPIRRPNGQRKGPEDERPTYGPCRKLDIELETGFFVGVGNTLGTTIPAADADGHIFGMVLLNDWSARDIQQWEYQPLGPFNSKGFATTISPWVVTMEALEPFRVEQPPQMPKPLSYLRGATRAGVDLHLEVQLKPKAAASPTTIARTNFKYMYWSMVQQLVHHTSAGCNTRVGDLLGSGTISGPKSDSSDDKIGTFGSLLELTWNGQSPLKLDDGETRSFIDDGDELTLTGWCQGDGYRVGFGSCVGAILPALEVPVPEDGE
ncbi:fumarylacetoacetate hydrolase [Paraburkholderia sp. BL6669N2]|uniref:fumarylacetoacetase n=1 Tax=Paraburkholderia sp. BL6669N2 TaxID=1938807 RepID=UPI000E27B297|nr:fumarylacetoacetase [Paraburkholderia sp. BL6669N2]REG59364.1 fumarylacetoacetate hydrolase [Paraburkholderia sp. BL6669N2]